MKKGRVSVALVGDLFNDVTHSLINRRIDERVNTGYN